MKKADGILIAAVAVIAAAFLFARFATGEHGNADNLMVVITKENGENLQYPLWEDREIKITSDYGYNIIQIRHGSVSVIEADCPGQNCVNSGRKSYAQETIACLPHKLIIQIR